MNWFIVGLGNPGAEYENTSHNTGVIVLDVFRKTEKLPDWKFDKNVNALVSAGEITPPHSSPLKRGGSSVTPPHSSPLNPPAGEAGRGGNKGGVQIALVCPQTFMNKSGDALRQIKDLRFRIKDKKKKIENLAVIHDDLDIPFGSYKISFDKSSGGHKGVESIIRALKTQAFVRVRVGISPFVKVRTKKRGGISSFVLKKPKGNAAVQKHILGKFSADELAALKKLAKRLSEAIAMLVTEGREKAMSRYN